MSEIRAIRRELAKNNNSKYKIVDSFLLINNKFGRAYFGKRLREEKGIKLYALKRDNSKNPLPQSFRNMISKLRRRIETTFYQLNERFNIEKIRSNSKIGLQSSLEIKLLCFNITSFVGGHTRISEIINFN